MAKRSKDSTYPSRYAPGEWVTPAQYIIEYVCENAAQYTGRDLPVRFWKHEEWERFFVSQTRAANKLLKKYTPRAIIATIKKKRLRSLIPKWIEGVIAKEQKQQDAERKMAMIEALKRQEQSGEPVSIINKQKPGKSFRTGSMNKLLALDEEIDNG